MGNSYTAFIKKYLANLPQSKRMTIDCQLNSLLENCLKIQLVVFRWADILGLRQTKLSQFVHFSLVFEEQEEKKPKYSATHTT